MLGESTQKMYSKHSIESFSFDIVSYYPTVYGCDSKVQIDLAYEDG